MPLWLDQILGNPTVVGFQAGQPVQQRLENTYTLEHLDFLLTGNLTLASYTTPPAKFVEAVENLIGNFQLTAVGNSGSPTTDQLCSVDAAFLRFKTWMMEGTAPQRADIGTANGTYAFASNFKKYFIDPLSDKTQLTRLNTASLASLTGTYQFRDQNSMVTGGVGGSATLSGVQVVVQARMAQGVTPFVPSPYVRESTRYFNIAGSTNLQRIPDVPIGNILRRQYWKGMLGTNSYSDPSDTVFGSGSKPEGPHLQLIINQNGRPILDKTYAGLRADNKTSFGVETMPSGYAVYEPARNRKLSQSLRLGGGVSKADNYVDTNYTGGSINTIAIVDEQIVKCSDAQFSAVAMDASS